MGKYVAKLAEDTYVEWSTVVDAPVSWVLNRDRAVAEWSEERVARADRNGTSIQTDPWGHTYPAGSTPEEIVRGNHAGPDGSEITVEEIIAAYDEANPAPWTVAHPLEGEDS